MSREPKDMTGALFKNNRKREDRQDPDYQGNCRISGVDLYISAWVNESQSDGRKYFGLKFKVREDRPDASPSATRRSEPQPPKTEPEFDDDIPF